MELKMMMNEITIRRAVPADREMVAEYNHRLAAETEDTILDRDVLARGVQAILADESKGLYFVAEAGGEIVGQTMVTFEWSDWRNGPIWWFQSVYVRSDWRRRGVFRRLYDCVFQAGRAAGAVEFRLYAVATNEPALKTYRRLGMKQTPYIVMERSAVEENSPFPRAGTGSASAIGQGVGGGGCGPEGAA